MKAFFTKIKQFILQHKVWSSVIAGVLFLSILAGIFLPTLIPLLTGKCKVSFETNGAGEVETIWVEKGESVPGDKLVKLAKENHTFIGWFTDDACEVQYINAPIIQNTTLYAGFVNTLDEEVNELEEIYIGEVAKDFALPIISADKLTNDTITDYISLTVNYGKHADGAEIKLSVKENGDGKYTVTANYAEPGNYTVALTSGKVHINGDDKAMEPYHLTSGNRVIQFTVGGENIENIVVNETVKNIPESAILASNDKSVQIATTEEVKVGDIIKLPYLEGIDHFKITGEITKAQAQNNGLTVSNDAAKFYSIALAEVSEIYNELDFYKKEDVKIDETTTMDGLAEQLVHSFENSQEMDAFTTLLLESTAYTPTVQKLSAQPLGNASAVQVTNVTPLAVVPKIEFNVTNTEFTDLYPLDTGSKFVKITVSLNRSATVASLADGEIQVDANVELEFYLHLHTEGWGKKSGSDAQWDVGVVSATQTKLSFEVAVSTKDNSPQALITGEIRDVLSHLEDTPADKLVDIYNRLVPDSESDRAELFRYNLVNPDLTKAVIGVVEVSFPVDIVLSVDFRAAMSAEFSVMTMDKHGVKGDTDSLDFTVYETNQPTSTTFEIYMQGKIDLRTGVEISVQVGFTGLSRLGNVKVSAQVGAYLKLYGMGYLIRESSQYPRYGGASYMETGIYLNFSVSATVLKWTAKTDLDDSEIPLYKMGCPEVVYKFAKTTHDTIVIDASNNLYIQDVPGLLDTYLFDITADNAADRLRIQDASALMADLGDWYDRNGMLFDDKIRITFDSPLFFFDSATGQIRYSGGYANQLEATMTIHYTGSTLTPGQSLSKQVKIRWWNTDALGEYDESKVGTKCTLTLKYNDVVCKTYEYDYGYALSSTYSLRNYTRYDQSLGTMVEVNEVPAELYSSEGINGLDFTNTIPYITEDVVLQADTVHKITKPVTLYYIDEDGNECKTTIYSPYGEVPDVSAFEKCPDTLEFIGWDKPMEADDFKFFTPYPWDQWHFHAQYAARYTAIVNFDTDGGVLKNALDETVNSKTATAVWSEEHTGYRIVNTATKEGYNFKGWEYNGNLYTLYDEVPLTPGSEVTLKAVFERKPIAITFNTYNGSLVQYYNEGDTVNLPNTEMNGVYLTGWKSQKDGQTYSISYSVMANDTLTAVYAESGVLVDFDLDGGVFPDGANYRRMYVPYGEKCNMTDIPIIDKGDGKVYTFSHWTPTYDQPITEHTTFKAVYKEEGKTHTVTFDLNGGKMPAGTKLPEGAVVSEDGSKISFTVNEGAYAPDIENPILIKDDGKEYGFVEWTPAFEPIMGDITYKAVFEEIVSVGPGENVDNPIEPGDVVGVHHKFENGVLTIYGTGKINNYLVDNEGQNVRPWDANYDKITKIVIEDGITYIGNHAFSYLPNLTTVEIADSVTSAGFACFMDCQNLTSVKLSSNMVCNMATYQQTGGNDFSSMFSGCSSLESITLPAGFTRVPMQMFHSCASLTTINLPNGLEIVEWGAFGNCTSLKSVTLPGTVKTIEMVAFSGCTALESININSGMDIASDAFDGCTSLQR